jgi:carboxyl-terminal processing protease
MRSCYLMVWCLGVLGLGATTAFAKAVERRPDDKPAPQISVDALVKSMWAVSDLVLEQDVDPPTRQEMMLGGIKALLHQAGASVPADLSRRISRLSTQKDFTVLVRECWPKGSVKVSDEQLTEAMLRGLLHRAATEPNLVSAKELKVQEQIRDNRYVGTGIQISMNPKENRGQIVEPYRGGPARKAGAKPGDLILEVDGKDTTGVDIRGLVDMIRGEEGTTVNFLVRQPGATETRTLKMTRGVVPFETVLGVKRGDDDAWMFHIHPDEPIAYVHIVSITSSTLHELRQVAQKLEAGKFRALVLDLREAHGDSIHHAALLADGLLDGGVLWQVRDAKERVKEYRADRDCLFRGWPLAVLLDDRAAPAAGWVAQALRNNRHAILVGDSVRDRRFARALIHLPDDQGAVGLRTGVVEFPNALPSPNPEEEQHAGGTIPLDHVVKMDAKHREALTKWFFAKNLSLLPEGVANEPPEDPQLDKAIQSLRQALAKAARNNKAEEPGSKRK